MGGRFLRSSRKRLQTTKRLRSISSEAAFWLVRTCLLDLGEYDDQGEEGEGLDEGEAQYQQKLDANPSGMLIYRPAGARAMTTAQLGTEFLTELAEALLVVFLLSRARLASYASRVGFIALAGVLAAITTNVPYWNWYGFPGNYTFGYMLTEIIGFVLVGFVAAAIVKTGAGQAVAARV